VEIIPEFEREGWTAKSSQSAAPPPGPLLREEGNWFLAPSLGVFVKTSPLPEGEKL
jgi:hypothetical protein